MSENGYILEPTKWVCTYAHCILGSRQRITDVVGGEFRVRVWGSKQEETEVGGNV
jgi:hypothetical protein